MSNENTQRPQNSAIAPAGMDNNQHSNPTAENVTQSSQHSQESGSTATPGVSEPVESVEAEVVQRTPSGKRFRIRDDLGISVYFEFQKMVVRMTGGGKKPEESVEALKWLATQIIEVEDAPLTMGHLSGADSSLGLTWKDGFFFSDLLGEYLPKSPAQES